MKRRRLLGIAALLLAALMSITAFAAEGVSTPAELIAQLSNAEATGITLSGDITLTQADGAAPELRRNVILKSDGDAVRTLTIGNGVTLSVGLPSAVSEKVLLKTAGTGRIRLLADVVNTAPAAASVKVDGKGAAAVKDGVYYVDVKTVSNPAKATVLVSVTDDFANSNAAEGSGEDKKLTLYLVNSANITRDGEGNITQITGTPLKGEFDQSKNEVRFQNVDVRDKTYVLMVKAGGENGSLVETDNRLTTFDSSKIKVTQSIDWANLKAARGYKAFAVTNPYSSFLSVKAAVTGATVSGSEMLSVTADGRLMTFEPMTRREVTVDFDLELPDGNKMDIAAFTKQVEVKSPITAPASVTVYTNERTRIFSYDKIAPGSDAYTGFELTKVSHNNTDILFSMDGGVEYITATKNLTADVTFEFTFEDADERATPGSGRKFNVSHTVKITSKTRVPTHVVPVLAPKTVLAAGESVQLSVPYEHISNAYSSNVNVALATGDGRVIALAPGTASISVTTLEHGEGAIQVVVTSSNASVYAGKTLLAEDETTQIYFGSNTPVTYAYTNNTRVLKVSSSGHVTALTPGTATVYVTGANGTGGVITFVVTQKSLALNGTRTIYTGQTAQLTLPVNEHIFRVTSSNPSVVRVNDAGFYTGVNPGTATITVTAISGRTGSFTVTVKGNEPVPVNEKTLKVGESVTLKVNGEAAKAAWSENEKIATVTNAGKVTAKSAGTTRVHLFSKSGKQVTYTITVTAAEKTSARKLKVDQSVTLSVSGKRIVAATLEDDNGVLSVTNSGKVTALKTGTDTVLLITSDNRVHRVKITVTANSGKISAKSVKLRSKAGSGSVLATLSKNTKVTIIARSGSYYKVQVTLKGKTYTGFVPRSNVKK